MNSKIYPYTLEELKNHFLAMNQVLQYKTVTEVDGQEKHVGDENDEDAVYDRILDYMFQIYPDKLEAVQKTSQFVFIFMYTSRHRDALLRDGLTASPRPDFTVLAPHYLRAMLEVFGREPIYEDKPLPDYDRVRLIAEELREDGDRTNFSESQF